MKPVLALLVLACGACGTTTLTARESLTPVMLGPVHYVGPDQGKLTHGLERRTYAADYGLAAKGGSNYYASQIDATIPHGLELAYADMPPDFMAFIKAPIECRLVHIFGLLVNIVDNGCRLETQQITAKVPEGVLSPPP
jgi:hypothetical protein